MSFVHFIEAARKIRAAIAEVKARRQSVEAVLANAPDDAAIAPSSDPRRRRLYLLATPWWSAEWPHRTLTMRPNTMSAVPVAGKAG